MSQAGWTDPVDPEAKGIEFNDESIRKGFIRKVFAILSVRNTNLFILNNISFFKSYSNFQKVQLSLTLGVIALFIFVPAVSTFALNHFWYY